MQQDFTMQGLQNLLYFPFRNVESRNRLLIASAIGLASFIIPILPGLFLLGYAGAIMRRIILDRKEPSMPEWSNWNEFLSLGVKLFGVNLIYAIPVLTPMVLGYAAIMVPTLLQAFSSDAYSTGSPDPLGGMFLLGTFGGMALFGIGMLFSLVLFVILPPALSHVVAKDSFAAGFQVRDWWKVFRVNIGGFLLAMVVAGGLYMVMMLAMQIIYMTIILCFLLPFLLAFISAYSSIIFFALFAQAYREGVMKLEAQAG